MLSIEVSKLATYTGHKDCIYSIIEGESPNYFFTSSGDGMIVKWNLEDPDNGKLFAQVPNSVYAMVVDPNSTNLIVAENFMGIHFINLENEKNEKSLKITTSAIFDLKIYRNLLFIACGDGKIIVLNLNDYTIIKTLEYSTQSARCIAIGDNDLYVGYSDNTIKVFDLELFKLKTTLNEHTNSVFTVAFNKDKNLLFSAGRDANLKIWNDNNIQQNIVAHMFAINHICFHPNGKLFATCSMDKSIKIWNAETFDLLKVIDKSRHTGHGTSINKLMWTTFNETLVSVSDDRTISTWKLDIKLKNIK